MLIVAKVCISLKINSSKNFNTEVLCKPFICLPSTNQPVKYAKSNFEFLKDLNLADSGTMEEIDMLIGKFRLLLVICDRKS